MKSNNFCINITPPPRYAAQRFNQLQADLATIARTMAADDVAAALAHQLNEPLTALLLYLHEIKEQGEHSNGTEGVAESIGDILKSALRETERVCDILERMGHTINPAVKAETTVMRGREAIDSLTWRSNAKGNGNGYAAAAQPHSSQNLLTTREAQVLDLIVGGASNKEGGHQLGISTRTFEVHRAHIMEKRGARNAADLVRMTLSETG